MRAADLSKIPDEKLANAPTNNLITERCLSVFSRRSVTAKCKNRTHTGELLRDNMVLHNAESKSLDKRAMIIQKELAEMNTKWFTSQKNLQLQKIKEMMMKKQKNIDYVLKLTETCKTWGGPCCSAEELKTVLKKNPDNEKKIIKTELSFYVHTHKADRLGRPELFKLSNIDTATMLENVFILLTNEHNSASRSSVAEISLPTNEDALKILSDDPKNPADHPVFEVNELCVNVWHEGEKIQWYVGYFKAMKGDIFDVEQLVRASEDSDLHWVHPVNQIVDEIDQFL